MFYSFSFRQQRFLDGEFSRRCLTFFIDLVTEFCFSREDFDRIEPEVIQKIMGYVFYSAEKKTKAFSPLNDYAIDPTPVVRSFILQQLLKR